MASAFFGGRVETDAVVSGGRKSPLCSNCRKTIRNSRQIDEYEASDSALCSDCKKPYLHAAHLLHHLFLVNLMHVIWTCNGCKKSCAELQDTMCYVCNTCKFYLCRSCFEPKQYLLHQHDLTKTDVRCIYTASEGGWKCDCCGGNNGFGHYLPRHCKTCQFDLCEKCCQPQRSTLHLHDLYKADTELIYQRFSGGWRCDSCSSRFVPATNKFPYHCHTCEFDLCDNCMRLTDSKVPRRPNNFCNRGTIGTTAAGHPVTSPEEELVAVNGLTPVQGDAMCIICLTKPKNATLIHGGTGHVCCCLDCAKKLQHRRDPCPICRQPIQLVIQQFLA